MRTLFKVVALSMLLQFQTSLADIIIEPPPPPRSELVPGTGSCQAQLIQEISLCEDAAAGEACDEAQDSCIDQGGVVAAGCEVDCDTTFPYPYFTTCNATVGCTFNSQ